MQYQAVVLVVYAGLARGFLRHPGKQTLKSVSSDGSDDGQPLFLTPYVERGDVAEGRRLARVSITDALNVTSYAGYFTVNKQFDSNHFLWYFPAMSGNPNAPVVLWLQGGPGGSSLYGLLEETGPVRVQDHNLAHREVHWALEHNLIYIDNPVGSGFSFTNHSDGFCRNETQIGEQLHSTLTQFFKLFPDLQKNKFFITGESYAGKYIPALAYTIHKKNPSAEVTINLKGFAIGNGWSDPEFQMAYGPFLNQIGLIDENQMEVLNELAKKAVQYIKQESWHEAFEQNHKIFIEIILMTGFEQHYNFLNTNYDLSGFGELFSKSNVRNSIHVGNTPYTDLNEKVYLFLKEDFMQSVSPWISELLDHYNVLVYNGQLDFAVPYPMTVNFLRNLNFTGADEYKTAVRHVWKVDGEVAGYYKQAGRLTEVLVRNAGHMVPHDQPKWALDLITKLTGATDQIDFSNTEKRK